jgi:SPX domain protein involved in polyphosphate accumulation
MKLKTTLVLTAAEVSALQDALKQHSVNMKLAFHEQDAVYTLNTSFENVYTLAGCIAVEIMQLEEELEDNTHFETVNALALLKAVRSKLHKLIHEAAALEDSTQQQQHDMN